jgi:hypothetical protein
MRWERITEKFEQLSRWRVPQQLQREIEDAVANLETTPVRELAILLGKV